MITEFEQGNQFVKQGKLEEAIVAYRQAIKNNPNFYLHYYNLGKVLEKLGYWEDALETYKIATELKPEIASSFLRLSKILNRLKRFNESQKAIKKAIKINPKLRKLDQVQDIIKANNLQQKFDQEKLKTTHSIKINLKIKKKIAVVLHAYYPELLHEIFLKLENLSNYDLFVTIPEEVVDSVTPVLNQYTQNHQIHIVKNKGNDILPFLELIGELDKLGYKYVCKIYTKRNHPNLNSLWRECLLDGILGDKNIIDQIITAFDNNTSLQIVGPAILYTSVLGVIYDGHQKINQIIHDFIQHLNPIEDWGFFYGTMFWSRISSLKYITDQILLKEINWESQKSQISIGENHLVEKLLGLASYINNGEVGLVDYKIIDTENVIKVLRIKQNFVPTALPIEYRLKSYQLVKNQLFTKYKLIYKANLFDPFYYLTKNPHILEQKIDGVEHYLTSNNKNYLSDKHESEKLVFSFCNSQLNYTDEHTHVVSLESDFVADIMGWQSLSNKNPVSEHEIKVSILCLTYNQEKYISQALEGFLIQKTNFKFEVIIGDDCSTDKTSDIIQNYVDRYPDLFVFVKRTKNLGVTQNFQDLWKRVKGRYIALNEGDDYWTDPMKLQIQVDYLDLHPECTICFHPVLIIDEDEPKKQNIFPLIYHHIQGIKFTIEHLFGRNFIQTNSVVYRWQFHDLVAEGFNDYLQPADWFTHILHAQYGEIHMLEKVMSVYRKHPGGIWSTAQSQIERMRIWGNQHIHFYRTVNQKYHSNFLFSMKNIFIDLAREYFEKLEIFNLYELIDKNRDIASIAFYYLNWSINIDQIFSPEDLMNEFKKVLTISTIIILYNNEEYIEKCLKSVVSQVGLFNHEIIIVDDFSTDNTKEIIKKYSSTYPYLIKIVPTIKHLGMLENLKKSFTQCKGNFIAICEGNDYWLSPTKLQKQLLFLLSRPELSMCFNWLLLYKQAEQSFEPHPLQKEINSDRITFNQLIAVDIVTNFSCCFYRREALTVIPDSYYQEERATGWLFNLCIAYKTDLGFIKELLSVYRLNDKGKPSKIPSKGQKELIQKPYYQLMQYFPDKHEFIKNFITNDHSFIISNLIPNYLENCQDEDTFMNIENIEFIYGGSLNIRGWFLNINDNSTENENKFLLIIDEKSYVLYSEALENCIRPDVEEAYNKMFNEKKVIFKNWSGFAGICHPNLPDGVYRLAIGKYADTKFIYKISNHYINSLNGNLSICLM